MGGMSTAVLDVATVKQTARGRWYRIFTALQISVPNNPRQHAPCPVCGGKDRFRLDDRDGSGSWFCNQCDPHSGDGFALTMKVLRLGFLEALSVVAGILGIDSTSTVHGRPRRPLPAPPVRIDRRAIAFRFEIGAADLRIRAQRIKKAAQGLDVESLTDKELDHALGIVAKNYADIARAELFEQVADGLRLREFLERKSDASRTRAA